jgi:hypothetical protein
MVPRASDQLRCLAYEEIHHKYVMLNEVKHLDHHENQ